MRGASKQVGIFFNTQHMVYFFFLPLVAQIFFLSLSTSLGEKSSCFISLQIKFREKYNVMETEEEKRYIGNGQKERWWLMEKER